MNLTKIKPIIVIVVLSITLFIVLLIISTFIFKNEEITNPPVEYKPSPPTQITPKKLPQETGFDGAISILKPILPYQGENYSIEFLETGNILSVKIKAKSVQNYYDTKLNAERFIQSQGIQDICVLNIFWVPETTQQVREKIDPKELITTGCNP